MTDTNVLSVADLTTGALDGTGAFDVLMRSIKEHLKSEFDAGRIKGTDYATAYIQALQAVLAQASQFVLASAKMPIELEILAVEKMKVQEEVKLTEAQINLSAAQMAVTVKEGAQVDANTLRVNVETDQARYTLKHILPKTVTKLDGELKLLTPQKDLLLAQVAKTTQETALLPEQLRLLQEQVNSQKAQSDLYDQKTITERAQTDPVVIRPGSVLGKQVELYSAQSTSYDQAAKREAAKVMVDTFLARLVQDPDGNLENGSNRLTDADVGSAVSKMLSSI